MHNSHTHMNAPYNNNTQLHYSHQLQQPSHTPSQEQNAFAKGITMPTVPQKSNIFEMDSQKQWEINALEKLATHPQTRAIRAPIPMKCPDCDMQGVSIHYTPTEYVFENLRWSTQQLHFVKTHGHDLPFNIRTYIPNALKRAEEYMQIMNTPKSCPHCNSQIDMSLQNQREIICYRCGMTFNSNVFMTSHGLPEKTQHSSAYNQPTTHPPQNPHFIHNTHDIASKSHDDTSEGFMFDRPSATHAPYYVNNEGEGYNEWESTGHSAFDTKPIHNSSTQEHISRKTKKYVSVLAEIEQSPYCMRYISNSNINCHICASKGVSMQVPVGTFTYSGITWGAHTLHNIMFHGESVPNDMKIVAKLYDRNKKMQQQEHVDPSHNLQDRGDVNVHNNGKPKNTFNPFGTVYDG